MLFNSPFQHAARVVLLVEFSLLPGHMGMRLVCYANNPTSHVAVLIRMLSGALNSISLPVTQSDNFVKHAYR